MLISAVPVLVVAQSRNNPVLYRSLCYRSHILRKWVLDRNSATLDVDIITPSPYIHLCHNIRQVSAVKWRRQMC